MALGILAAASAWQAKETRDTRKETERQYAEKKAEAATEKKKMDEEIAAQKAKQQADLERQKQKETRKAKRGASGYAGTVLTQGIKPDSMAAQRKVLGVG
jgi:hypothetical protein